MYLYRKVLFLQIVAFMISYQIGGGNTSTVISSTTSMLVSSSVVNGTSSTLVVSMTSTVANTSTIQPTPASSTAAAVSSLSVAAPTTTPPPPPEGEQEAVVLTVEGMTLNEFEAEKSSFIDTLKTIVESYCAGKTCAETSRKRRATTVDQVYIASGYPKESSTGVLQVAVFVSTGGNKFLSKHVLVVIVEEFRGNLSEALGKPITGWGRLHLDVVKTTESTGTSDKTRLLYYFFAGFAGVVLILAVCIGVTCWVGRKSEKQTQNEVRPITTSSLELVEDRGGRVNEGLESHK